MTPKAFLLDLDGTLVDSVADLRTAVNALRCELSLPALDLAQVRDYVGDGARLLVTRALPPGAFTEAHLDRFLVLYRRHLLDQTRPYPGIVEFLRAHPREKLAVVTNKPYRLSLELLQGLGLAEHFAVILGGDSCATKKPDPAPLREALRQIGAAPEQAVMIGDHHTDLHAGRAAGTAICFCAWGLGHDDGLATDFRAEQVADLLRLFPGARA
ncbi:HAD family hydrolase [Geoalkalibacter sp.]|uniref:HAD family hydrolase n=1 Tax=Geoalkalibacter sp. TaxID=3041440 RepID=UPI00272DE65D|nr:HAD-IA family hydrolase [Geoalkalibacter sp.]